VRQLRRDTGKEAGMMETFTLVVWLWAGMARHETQRPGLSEIECKLQAAEVQKPRRAVCVLDRTSPTVPYYRPDDRCAHCGATKGRKLT
jgi:hypothetical protein